LEKWIPKKKQIGFIGNSVRTGSLNKPSLNLPEIEGVDTLKGIRLTGGTVEYYYETLATFYTDGRERINEIKQCVETNDLPMFSIHVHALKSAVANIGADELSKLAYALELAAQNGELQFIKNNSNNFLSMLERLLDNIKTALSLREAGGNSVNNYDSVLFTSRLNALKEALKDMNGEVINKTVESLLRLTCPDNIKSAIRSISSHLLMTEYDEAESLIDTLLQKQ
jgi:HPt (histidine-containing phosphotransfer) domain-containing protein